MKKTIGSITTCSDSRPYTNIIITYFTFPAQFTEQSSYNSYFKPSAHTYCHFFSGFSNILFSAKLHLSIIHNAHYHHLSLNLGWKLVHGYIFSLHKDIHFLKHCIFILNISALYKRIVEFLHQIKKSSAFHLT